MAGAANLFDGTKFWLSNRTPSKARFVEEIQKHGGIIVPLERLADMLIVDHMRKDNFLPNSYSYRYIDLSIRKGQLEIKDDHLIQNHVISTNGTGQNNVGATPRSTRTPFTEADDKELVKWMRSNRERPLLGNAVFRELAEKNPRHTTQSWRDRWVKRLQHTTSLDQKNSDQRQPPVSPATIDHRPDAIAAPIASSFPSSGENPPLTGQSADSKTQQSGRYSVRTDLSSQGRASAGNSLHRVTVNHEVSPKNVRSSNGTMIHGALISPQNQSSPTRVPQAVVASSRSEIGSDLSIREDFQSSKVLNENSPLNHVKSVSAQHPEIAAIRGISRSNLSRSNTPNYGENSSTASMPPSKTKTVSRKVNLTYQNHLQEPSLGDFNSDMIPSKPRHGSAALLEPDEADLIDIASKDESEDDFLAVGGSPVDMDDERLAIAVWKKLLRDFGETDRSKINDSAILIANVPNIRSLSEEDFQVAWDNWWRTNPQRTEQEWLALFNEHCLPFYIAHEKAFRRLYKEYLRDLQNQDQIVSDLHGTDDNADGYATGSSTVKMQVLQPLPEVEQKKSPTALYSPADLLNEPTPRMTIEASPELGSRVYRNNVRSLSPELGSSRKRPLLTPDSSNKRRLQKFPGSSSEIPESPKLKEITNLPSKQQKRHDGKSSILRKDNREIPASPEVRTTYNPRTRPSIQESEDGSDSEAVQQPSARANKTGTRLHASNKINTPRRDKKAAKAFLRFPSETLSEPHDQASIDRQLWSEEAGTQEERSLFVPDVETDQEEEEQRQSLHPRSSFSFGKDSTPNYQPDSELLPRRHRPSFMSNRFESAGEGAAKRLSQQYGLDADSDDVGDDGAESDFEERLENETEWFQRKREHGYDDAVLIMILNAVTMDVRLASKTLQYYLENNKLPKTKAGVWTPDDDAKLATHSRMAKRALVKKHGSQAIEQRKRHLEMLRSG